MNQFARQRRALTQPISEGADRALVRLIARLDDERGDIPGWVMVTVMTAMLVAAIGTLAEAEFKGLLSAALDKVRN